MCALNRRVLLLSSHYFLYFRCKSSYFDCHFPLYCLQQLYNTYAYFILFYQVFCNATTHNIIVLTLLLAHLCCAPQCVGVLSALALLSFRAHLQSNATLMCTHTHTYLCTPHRSVKKYIVHSCNFSHFHFTLLSLRIFHFHARNVALPLLNLLHFSTLRTHVFVGMHATWLSVGAYIYCYTLWHCCSSSLSSFSLSLAI